MKYRSKPVEVEAIQFEGTEESARAVIVWGAQCEPALEITRYWRKGSWNDSKPDLWLHIGKGSLYAEPGNWVVHDGHEAPEVWGAAGFVQEYEAVEA